MEAYGAAGPSGIGHAPNEGGDVGEAGPNCENGSLGLEQRMEEAADIMAAAAELARGPSIFTGLKEPTEAEIRERIRRDHEAVAEETARQFLGESLVPNAGKHGRKQQVPAIAYSKNDRKSQVKAPRAQAMLRTVHSSLVMAVQTRENAAEKERDPCANVGPTSMPRGLEFYADQGDGEVFLRPEMNRYSRVMTAPIPNVPWQIAGDERLNDNETRNSGATVHYHNSFTTIKMGGGGQTLGAGASGHLGLRVPGCGSRTGASANPPSDAPASAIADAPVGAPSSGGKGGNSRRPKKMVQTTLGSSSMVASMGRPKPPLVLPGAEYISLGEIILQFTHGDPVRNLPTALMRLSPKECGTSIPKSTFSERRQVALLFVYLVVEQQRSVEHYAHYVLMPEAQSPPSHVEASACLRTVGKYNAAKTKTISFVSRNKLSKKLAAYPTKSEALYELVWRLDRNAAVMAVLREVPIKKTRI